MGRIQMKDRPRNATDKRYHVTPVPDYNLVPVRIIELDWAEHKGQWVEKSNFPTVNLDSSLPLDLLLSLSLLRSNGVPEMTDLCVRLQ